MQAEPYEGPFPELPGRDGFLAHRRFFFTTGLRGGEIAPIRGDGEETLLTYRSFASVIGTVATLVGAIVLVAGLAGTALLVAEGAPLRAIAALVLTAMFTGLIFRLVPRMRTTLYEGTTPVLSIDQVAAFPTERFNVGVPGGGVLGQLGRGLVTRLGRNRWMITQQGRVVAEAFETPLTAALVRKLLGKFDRRWEADIRLEQGRIDAGRIRRQPDVQGRHDYLDLAGDALDPRLAIALATVILGRER